MSHSRIRKDKRCQNCGHFVAEKLCPACGQENAETRRRFHYLFVHFFEDFVHYDSLFWKNIKSLLFSPAKLTKEYLAGKRKSQVNPVQLYIFISFLVFFLPAVLPDFEEHPEKIKHEESSEDSLFDPDDKISMFGLENVGNVAELDSIQQSLPKEKKLSIYKYAMLKKILAFKQKKNPREEFIESLVHNFSKAVFLYMPIFAFWLWLFHSKKKWLYFDHGIYTLHYFSFILFTILLYIVSDWVLSLFHTGVPALITMAMFAYFIYYFFHSHRRMYLETKMISRLLCIALFFINTVCAIIFLLFYGLIIIVLSAK